MIFACIHNAGRSQMAAAWFNALADPTKARAISAGHRARDARPPEVLEAMREVGIDLARSNAAEADRRARARRPDADHDGMRRAVPGRARASRRDDWPLEDPKGKPIARVREIRDDVRARVIALLPARGLGARMIRPRRLADVESRSRTAQ